jgi:hypothetical protein
MMEDTHALDGVSDGKCESALQWHLQESQTQYHSQTDLLSSRHTQLRHQRKRQSIGENIRKDINSRIRQVKSIDIDTLLIRRQDSDVVRSLDRRALEDTRQDIGSSLTTHDSHHEEGDFSERLVAEAGIECEDRDLDEAETGVVEDGGEPDDLHVGDKIVGASFYYVGVVATQAMIDGWPCEQEYVREDDEVLTGYCAGNERP